LPFQSKISVPKGYNAVVLPLPIAGSHGLSAATEPFFGCDYPSALRRGENSTILLHGSTTIGSVWQRPRDYIEVPRGMALACIRFQKNR
jgi:hypothetical protein